MFLISTRTLEDGKAKLEAGDVASASGGKVVALTVPMTLALHLNFLGGFVLDALPEWENFILLSKEDKLAALRDLIHEKYWMKTTQQEGLFEM